MSVENEYVSIAYCSIEESARMFYRHHQPPQGSTGIDFSHSKSNGSLPYQGGTFDATDLAYFRVHQYWMFALLTPLNGFVG